MLAPDHNASNIIILKSIIAPGILLFRQAINAITSESKDETTKNNEM